MPKTAKNSLGETFYQLTEEEAREWYRLKYINTTAYLLVIKRLLTKPDVSLTIPNVLEFCREWGISKSSFYRAVDTLRSDNKFTWEATQGIILTPCRKVVTIPRAGQCPTSGTVSHERDSESHERDSESHERDSESHERDSDIYIDRAHDRSNTDLNTDLSQIYPPTPQGEKSECEAVAVVVEVLPEEDSNEQSDRTHEPQEQLASLTKFNSSEGQDSGEARCNNKTLQKLIERFENGEITKLPPHELKMLADAVIGDYVAEYRQSGNINSANPNDIRPEFLAYVTSNHLSSRLRNSVNAFGRIRNIEQEPTQWRSLVEMVEGWLSKRRVSTFDERNQTPAQKTAEFEDFMAELLSADA